MKHQNGYVMVSVLFALFIIATVSLNLNREGAFNIRLASDKLSTSQAKLTTRAGMTHLLNKSTNLNCNNYSDISSTNFGSGVYTASISPLTGSPVSTFVSATMDDGSYAELKNENQIIYQPAKPLSSITTADSSAGDTHVSNSSWFNANDTNYSTVSYLSVGDNIFSTKNYALLKFNIDDIPSSTKVLSAQLKLNLTSANKDSGDATLSIHRILIDWDPAAATYKTSGSNSWSWPDLYASEPASVLTLQSTAAGPREWSLTQLVQGWIDGRFPAYGFALVANDKLNMASFDSANASDSSLAPSLQIQYTCECGLYCESTTPLPVSVAHWKFDENSGATAYDSVGTNDGTTTGATWVSGQIEGGLSFNGSSDFVVIPHANELSFDKEISISAWIYLAAPATGSYANQTIIGKGTTSNTDEYWLGIWENEIEFGILDSGTWYGVSTIASDLQIGSWHHVAMTFSDHTDEALFYLDGAIVGNRTLTQDFSTDNEDILIGTSQYDEDWYGMLDDIRLFDHIISPDEVTSLALVGGITATKTKYVLDKFDEEKFSGNDGSISWTGDWQEVGESDGPTSGDVRITTVDDREFTAIVKDNDNGGEGIQRKANLQGCSSAKLAFEYKRSGFDVAGDDHVSIAASNNGGTSWTELDKIDRPAGSPASDSDFVKTSYDISSYVSNETMIRFKTSPSLGNNDSLAIDNIEIRLTGCL